MLATPPPTSAAATVTLSVPLWKPPASPDPHNAPDGALSVGGVGSESVTVAPYMVAQAACSVAPVTHSSSGGAWQTMPSESSCADRPVILAGSPPVPGGPPTEHVSPFCTESKQVSPGTIAPSARTAGDQDQFRKVRRRCRRHSCQHPGGHRHFSRIVRRADLVLLFFADFSCIRQIDRKSTR